MGGKMSGHKIPVTFQYPMPALTTEQAARALGVSRQTVWRLKATGEIRATAYGVIPVSELQRHLQEQIKNAEQ